MMTNSEALDKIRQIVGNKGWLDQPDDIQPHTSEMRGLWNGHCDLVVSPETTQQVADIVGVCAASGLPVVAHGGNTGLVGAGVPNGGVLLTTHRMNEIRNIDPVDNTMSVDAGVILADIQAAANNVDRLFPLSLGAEGSCRIGGNLSTNCLLYTSDAADE